MRRSELESAIRLREVGDYQEAESLLVRVLAESLDDTEANHQMAWLYDVQSREREAVPYYVRAIAGDLSDEERRGALLGLGSTYRAMGEYPEAVEVLGQGVSEFPADRAMQTFLALALYNVGEHRQAVDLLLKHLVETTSDPGIRSYEKALRFYAGRLDEVWG
ncbi:MAG TPA: tetratricopeptide repeat protein [Rubrobacter sp.]